MTAASLPSWMRPADTAATAGATTSDTWEATVVARDQLASEVVCFELAPTSGEPPRWEPGAHIDVHVPDGEASIRQYSLCGDPADSETLRIAVLREPDGRGGSVYLHDSVEVGDTLRLGGPRNNFQLKRAPSYVFIAGGIGITPLLPMLQRADEAGAEWSLTYGGRTRSTMAFLDRVEQHAETTIVAEDEHGIPDLTALLAEPRPGGLIYSCGPEALLNAVEDASAHWPSGSLHVERFRPRADLLQAPSHAFEVILNRSGTTLTVTEDRSILDVLAGQGVSVPSSCREGTCGTCETDVLSGEVDHRDSLLTDAEKAANDCMMICVSRACGSQLVLDL